MKATQLEFRFRAPIMVAVVVLGFWSPWIEAWHIGARISLFEWAAVKMSRAGLLSFTDATAVLIVFASLMAAASALLRVWGTAYLGAGVMSGREMNAGRFQADGPYRYVRNPLYLGSWCLFAALAFVMPASGAAFSMVLLTVFLVRLILGEESFLAAQLGEPYRAYLGAVPRLLPRLRTNLSRAGAVPQWGRAVLAELNPVGVFFVIAILAWGYNGGVMVKAILINYGISLIGRAMVPASRVEVEPVKSS